LQIYTRITIVVEQLSGVSIHAPQRTQRNGRNATDADDATTELLYPCVSAFAFIAFVMYRPLLRPLR